MQDLEKLVSTIYGIDSLQINSTIPSWKDALLSGREGNDLVTLYFGKDESGNQILISESQFSENQDFSNVQQMVNSRKISLGYPIFYIKEALGIKGEVSLETPYPLLYRSASIILEAYRLNIPNVVLFLETSLLSVPIIRNYEIFARLLLTDGRINCFHKSLLHGRTNFYFGLFSNNLVEEGNIKEN